MLPYEQALDRYSQLAGRNRAFEQLDNDRRTSQAKAELQAELQRQRKELRRQQEEQSGWKGSLKQGFGQALQGGLMGLATGNPMMALAGAGAGFAGGTLMNKLGLNPAGVGNAAGMAMYGLNQNMMQNQALAQQAPDQARARYTLSDPVAAQGGYQSEFSRMASGAGRPESTFYRDQFSAYDPMLWAGGAVG